MAARVRAFAVLPQMAGVGQQLGVAMAGGQFVEAAVADCVGGPLGGEIAAAFVGRAHVAQYQFEQRFDQFTAFVELQGRDDNALLVQLCGKGQGAGRHAADVGVMGAAGGEKVGGGRRGERG